MIWHRLKYFIGLHKRGDIITRQNMMYYFNTSYNMGLESTLDVYRKYLTAANYLTGVSNERYKLAYYPGDITLNECRERVYPGYIEREKKRKQHKLKSRNYALMIFSSSCFDPVYQIFSINASTALSSL